MFTHLTDNKRMNQSKQTNTADGQQKKQSNKKMSFMKSRNKNYNT